MSDKFDFNTASLLIQVVEQTAANLEVKNGQMESRFGKLREGFKDSGYDDFAVDMTAANNAIGEIIAKLHEISNQIGEYSEKLQQI